MWRQILKNTNFQLVLRRTYLSEAYKLNTEWNSRLNTAILEKVNAETLYVELCSRFQQKKKITAIDVDIYLNKASGKHTEEACDLLHKLRTTEQTSRMLDSTPHAMIRLLMDHPEHLLSMLNNRLEYGLFLDSHAANLLLNKSITEKNFMLGARIATLQMLQEDFEHPITRYMSLYASYKFLDELSTFVDLIPPPPPPEDTNAPKQKKKVEEIKVRVAFIRNEYFDDHFDIVNTNHLLGKTFLYLADEVKSVDSVLCNSLKLLGYALYEKFSDGNKFIEKSDKNSQYYKEVLDKVKGLAEKIENLDSNDDGKKFFDALNSISSQKEGKVDEILEGLMKKSISECESSDIEAQRKV
jgi:small subunit ribosomal protein S27